MRLKKRGLATVLKEVVSKICRGRTARRCRRGAARSAAGAAPRCSRHKLYLKGKLQSSSSYCSFKRLVPGAFNMGLIGSTCTALPRATSAWRASRAAPTCRGLHSSTFQLNLSRFGHTSPIPPV